MTVKLVECPKCKCGMLHFFDKCPQCGEKKALTKSQVSDTMEADENKKNTSGPDSSSGC